MLETEPGIASVETVPSGEAAIQKVPSLRPDVVVADHGLPGISGNELATELRRLCPSVHIVSFSGSDAGAPWADQRVVKGTANVIEDLRAAVSRAS